MMRRCCGVFVMFLLAGSTVLAQTSPAPPPPDREVSAEVAFVSTTGNSPTQSLSLGGGLILRRPTPWILAAKAGYVRNKADEVLRAESFTGLFRASRAYTERLSFYGQYGYLRDVFSGIQNRNAVDGGIEYLILDEERQRFRLDAALGYAHETRVIGDRISTAQATAGLGYKLKITETSELTDDAAVTFALSNGDDWRLSNVIALSAKISEIFSLKLSNTVRFVNAPVEGFEKTDTITSAALVAKF
jgi:putative salt-induced outer membrane protein YdiY